MAAANGLFAHHVLRRGRFPGAPIPPAGRALSCLRGGERTLCYLSLPCKHNGRLG
ncbi:hypothetical protein [Azospirillum doebereinerae]